MSEEQCCGTCGWAFDSWDGTSECSAPIPVAVTGWNRYAVFDWSGQDCPCWKKKEESHES